MFETKAYMRSASECQRTSVNQRVFAGIGIVTGAQADPLKAAAFIKADGGVIACAHFKQNSMHTHFTRHLQGQMQNAAAQTLAARLRDNGQVKYFQLIHGMIDGNIGHKPLLAKQAKGCECRLRKSRAALLFRPGERKTAPLQFMHHAGMTHVKTLELHCAGNRITHGEKPFLSGFEKRPALS